MEFQFGSIVWDMMHFSTQKFHLTFLPTFASLFPLDEYMSPDNVQSAKVPRSFGKCSDFLHNWKAARGSIVSREDRLTRPMTVRMKLFSASEFCWRGLIRNKPTPSPNQRWSFSSEKHLTFVELPKHPLPIGNLTFFARPQRNIFSDCDAKSPRY